jgi:hypothetical protein
VYVLGQDPVPVLSSRKSLKANLERNMALSLTLLSFVPTTCSNSGRHPYVTAHVIQGNDKKKETQVCRDGRNEPASPPGCRDT